MICSNQQCRIAFKCTETTQVKISHELFINQFNIKIKDSYSIHDNNKLLFTIKEHDNCLIAHLQNVQKYMTIKMKEGTKPGALCSVSMMRIYNSVFWSE